MLIVTRFLGCKTHPSTEKIEYPALPSVSLTGILANGWVFRTSLVNPSERLTDRSYYGCLNSQTGYSKTVNDVKLTL